MRIVTTFTDDVIEHFSALGQIQTAQAGQTLLFQGEPSTHIGLIISGRAKAAAYSEEGAQTWLGRFDAGEFFGHIAFLSQSEIRFEVIAETDMQIRIIAAAQIEPLLKNTPEISELFARDLARRLDTMMVRLVEALTLSAKGRVCAELFRLSNPIGVSPEKSVIRPNPVFVDLALRINSTRETVSRTISELSKQEIISREAGAIVIQNPDALRRAIK